MNINYILYNLIVCSMLGKIMYSLIHFILNDYINGYKMIPLIGYDLYLLYKLDEYKYN